MKDNDKEILELSHRMDLHDKDEIHSKEENEAAHAHMNNRIESVVITVDGHEVRLDTLEGKATAMKAKAVDSIIKWALGIIGTAVGGGVLFWLGTIFGGVK